jgi:hypothetical protein
VDQPERRLLAAARQGVRGRRRPWLLPWTRAQPSSLARSSVHARPARGAPSCSARRPREVAGVHLLQSSRCSLLARIRPPPCPSPLRALFPRAASCSPGHALLPWPSCQSLLSCALGVSPWRSPKSPLFSCSAVSPSRSSFFL